MRLLVQDYLAQLKERDELDIILPDLLRSMGFQVIKLAFRGEVEHGVDVAAIKVEQDKLVLYLFQVKAGDIDPQMWDAGPNSVRGTLNNLLDVPFKDLTQPRLRDARRVAVLVHNGTLRENIRERFNGYIQNDFTSKMEFDRWDIDRLAKLFHDNLLNERLLPREYQILLKRTLIFLDVPDYDLTDFKYLINKILSDTETISGQKAIRLFSFIRLLLAIVHRQCQTNSNLSPSLATYEYALLSLWGWIYKGNRWRGRVKEEFIRTYQQYIDVLSEWVKKVSPAIEIRDGLAFNGLYELVEYPIRTFQTISNISILAIAHAYNSNIIEGEDQIRQCGEELQKYSKLLLYAIQNNKSRHRPLLDNHLIDIFLGIWALLLSGNHQVAYWWLNDILEHLAIRKKLSNRLPELYNNIDLVVEYESTGERPVGYVDSSSTLIYMLFELCLLFNSDELYDRYRPFFGDIKLQVWYPPENIEEILYHQEVFDGDTETLHGLPANFDEFRLDVQARHQQWDKTNFSPLEQNVPLILLLASKHFRTPIFPFWWRSLIFPEESAGLQDQE